MNLSVWFHRQVEQSGGDSRRQIALLALLGTTKHAAMIGGFWWLSIILHSMVVEGELAPDVTPLFALCLTAVWLLSGAISLLTNHYKLVWQQQLEAQLIRQFQSQQHALVRQHPPFYWQCVWLKHIPALVNWLFDYRVQQLVAVLVPVIALISIYFVNWPLGLVLTVSLPIVPLFMILVGKGAARVHHAHFTAFTRLGALFVNRLRGLPLLASYNAHEQQSQILQTASEQLNHSTMRVVRVAFLSNTVLDFFATLAVALVAVLIGFTLLGEVSLVGDISFQQGVWLLLTVPLLLSELKKLGVWYHQKGQAEAAMEACGDLFTGRHPKTGETQTRFKAFNAINWHLGNGAVKAATLTIKQGNWIQISGKSGAGKSQLLEGLSGQRKASIQLACPLVTLGQTPVVMPCSVRENLALDRTYSDDRLWHVLHVVGLEAWCRVLPLGLDTQMGEYPPLSGGQAHRLALARALLIDAQVWLLDEPTAHLPDQLHRDLIALIRNVTVNKTVLWVSHKPLPSQWFDKHWQVIDGEVKPC